MGSKSRSATTTSTSTSTLNYNALDYTDGRDFSDRRVITDRSTDKRAVLRNAQQIMDSIYLNVDPSDKVLQSVVLSWERQATELLKARQFDTKAANDLLGEIIDAAERGVVSMNENQLAQFEAWQRQLSQTIDFAAASLATGERLIQSAGQRQASITDRILDLAAGAVGQTSNGQIRLIAWTLAGVAAVVFAARRGRIV